ncbi:hypothetical protein FB107DRAFT_276651 [Schizophyllum commune]
MPPPIPRILTAPQAALDAFKARSHLLGQLARRILGVVYGLVALRNARLTPIVPRSAPVPLGDRCDTSPWWAGGEERRGAPLRYAFGRANNLQMDVKCAKVRAGSPRQWSRLSGRGEGRRAAPPGASSSCEACLISSRRLAVLLARFRRPEIAHPSCCTPWKARQTRLYLLPSLLEAFSARSQPLSAHFHGLRRSSSSRTTSNMLGSNRSSSGEQGIPFAPFAFACPVFPLRLPPPLGDEYTYRRPPSKVYISDSATLFEPPAPLATPSILVSTAFNISQALGAEIT